jgi:hypothetical protein
VTWWQPAEPSAEERARIEGRLRQLRNGEPIRSSFEVKQVHAAARRELAGLLVLPSGSSERLIEERITATPRATLASMERERRLQEEYDLTRLRERSSTVRRGLVDQCVESFRAQTDANPKLRGVLTNIYSPGRTAYPDAYIFGTLHVTRRVRNPEREREQALAQRDRDLRRTEGVGIAEPGGARVQAPAFVEVPDVESVLLLRLDWEASELSNEERPQERSALERALARVGAVLEVVLDVATLIDGIFIVRYGAVRVVRWVARAGGAARRIAVGEVRAELAAGRAIAAESRAVSGRALAERLPATREAPLAAEEARAAAAAPGTAARAVARAAEARDVAALTERLATLAPRVSQDIRRRVVRYVLRYSKISRDDETLRALSKIFARVGREQGFRVQIRAGAGELAVIEQLNENRAVQRIQAIAETRRERTADFAITLANGEVRAIQVEVRTVTRARAVDRTRPRGIELPPGQRGAPSRAPSGAPYSDRPILNAFRSKLRRGQISEQGVIAVHLTYAPVGGAELISARTLDAINLAASTRPEALELWLSVPTKTGRVLWRIDRKLGSLGLVERWPAPSPP